MPENTHQTPSAAFRRGPSLRLDAQTGLMVPTAPTPPSKAKSGARAGLAEILAPRARQRWMAPQARQMTPARIEHILRSALASDSLVAEQALYTLMEGTWPRLLKNRLEVTEAVCSLDWTLQDAPEGERLPGARELIERTMNGMRGDPAGDGQGWQGTMRTLMDAWFRGVTACEILWEYRGQPGAWLPRETYDLPAHAYGWHGEDGRLRLYPQGSPEVAIDFPPHKFLLAVRKAGKGHPSGTALLRTLAWWWCVANFSAEWLLGFAQIFGQPLRNATYDPSQEGLKEELARMMEDMAAAPWVIVPEGVTIDFIEAQKSGADNPQAHLLDLADRACDLLLLGQTLTTDVAQSGSRALGEVHNAVRADIIDSAAKWLAEILNEQLIPAVITLNHGDPGEDSRLPWLQPARKEKKDSKLAAETFEIVLRSGIPLVKAEVYERLDLQQPGPKDETITGGGGNSTLPAGIPPELRPILAKLPLDAREYLLSRLG